MSAAHLDDMRPPEPGRSRIARHRLLEHLQQARMDAYAIGDRGTHVLSDDDRDQIAEHLDCIRHRLLPPAPLRETRR